VILITDRFACQAQAESGMLHRSIAVFVLATLCWLSMPVAFGSLQIAAIHSAQHNASPEKSHSCCPGVHPRVAPALLVGINSSGMPCGAQHPCCASQRPENPSTLPVANKRIRPVAERISAIAVDKLSPSNSQMVNPSTDSFSPPFERSTVLRN